MDFVDGRKPVDTVVRGGELTLYAPRIGKAASLVELAGDFVFYTSAIAHLFCHIPENPLVTLSKSFGGDFAHFAMQFDRPVFARLPPPHSHVVYGIGRDAWDAFANQLKGTTVLARQDRLLMQLRLRELTVLDPLEQQRRGLSTGLTCKIWAVCLETNRGCYYLDDSAGLLKPPEFRYTAETFPDFVEQAERLLGPVQG